MKIKIVKMLKIVYKSNKIPKVLKKEKTNKSWNKSRYFNRYKRRENS